MVPKNLCTLMIESRLEVMATCVTPGLNFERFEGAMSFNVVHWFINVMMCFGRLSSVKVKAALIC